jgi:hypothetical protein
MPTTVNIGDDAPSVVAAAGASETFNFAAGTHNQKDWSTNGGVIEGRNGDTYVFTGSKIVCATLPLSLDQVTTSVTITNADFDIREDPIEDAKPT